MAVEITVTVKSTNHTDETVITKTYSTGTGNPRYDGSIVRKHTAELAEHIAGQLDRLVGEPLSDAL